MIVTVRIKSSCDDKLTHFVFEGQVIKLLKSFNGKHITGLVYETEADRIRHIMKLSDRDILTMDGIEYDMGNDWEQKKFEETFSLLNALDTI